ncbi:MAG: hypothetical protein ACREJU_11400, partial [Nitrospiraceae bacterium]
LLVRVRHRHAPDGGFAIDTTNTAVTIMKPGFVTAIDSACPSTYHPNLSPIHTCECHHIVHIVDKKTPY